nr:immunoglobulin heavy chain junction region [Mus musculus]MBK4186638.1 immunoglobulin heavy chain junction region [Mus musculus]
CAFYYYVITYWYFDVW